MLYMGTAAPGIETVVESEIQAKLSDAWIQNTFRGRILFGCMRPTQEVLSLRCIDNLYAHIAWFHVGPHKADLKQIEHVLSSTDITSALSLLPNVPLHPQVFVSASRSGKHSYSRYDAAEVVFTALQKEYGFSRGDLYAHDLAFRFDIMDGHALLSLKLTPPTFRFRGNERGFATAALRPPLAHALVWASSPSKEDIFLDPFCGSGTIVAERATYEAGRLIASDLAAEAVAVARKNTPAHVEVSLWDARHISMASQSVDCIVTNPPWGNQVAAGTDIEQLYTEFLAEAKRVMVTQGRMIMLTDQVESLQHSCQALGLPCTALYQVSLHGLVPSVFEIKVA